MRFKTIFSAIIVLLLLGNLAGGCKSRKNDQPAERTDIAKTDTSGAKITFVELGSVNCIPCRQMQPVRAIEKKFAGQVKVVFYDVWQKDQNHYAYDYHINLIPTQVFFR